MSPGSGGSGHTACCLNDAQSGRRIGMPKVASEARAALPLSGRR
ncbi:hypothetical protein [Cohnella faecalis]|nr:hypothetical protein [Cohnella faecalis]